MDVSKDLFSAPGLGEKGKELFSGSYEMNSHGFEEFMKTLSSHCEKPDQVMAAMESTGCYQINVCSFCMGKGTPLSINQESSSVRVKYPKEEIGIYEEPFIL